MRDRVIPPRRVSLKYGAPRRAVLPAGLAFAVVLLSAAAPRASLAYRNLLPGLSHGRREAAGPRLQDPNAGLEAVLETSEGTIVIDFFPAEAPKHVQYFIDKAREGAYDGTTFHQILKDGYIQGGDPFTKDPRAQARYGTGGLHAGIPDEVNSHKHITGAVSAALATRGGVVEPNSGGMRFFIAIGAQPALDSKFSVFGRVVEGMDVAVKISRHSALKTGIVTERIELKKVTIRPMSPTEDEMKNMQGVFDTSMGAIKVHLAPETAPEAARAFIRFAREGLYDGTSFYRVSQKYFIEGGNLNDWPADSPNRKRFFSLWSQPFEPNDVVPGQGTLSVRKMGDGTTSWDYYFISKDNPALKGHDDPIGKVVEGQDVLDKISNVDVDGDKPKQPITVNKVTIQ